MKIFQRKRATILLFMFIFSIAFSIAGCSMDNGDDDDKSTTGILRLQISNSISKALIPSINMTPSEYILTGSSDTGGSYSDVLGGNTYTTELELGPGVWTLSITANNAAEISIGSGSVTATVTAGKTTYATIGITELSGNGSLSLSVEWTAADVSDPGIGCYLQPVSGSPIPLNFTINESAGTATLNSSTIPAGSYTLYVKLQDGVNVIPDDGAGLTIDGTFESVRIVQGQTTSGSYTFPKTGSFITSWKTDNDGVSDDNQITLPLIEAGTYDFVVSWGDGSQSHITSWTEWDAADAPRTHTYSSAGTYTVQMTGWIRGFSFFDQGDGGTYHGDSPKLIGISKWGTLDFGVASNGSDGTDFYECSNMTITATDIPNFEDTLNVNSLFSECSVIASIPNIDQWDTSNITDMSNMFYEATNFDQNLGDWDVSKVTDMTGMLTGVSLSNANYDTLLIGWNALPSLKNNVVFDAGNSYFETGVAARGNIISTYSWTITDLGPAP